MITIAIAAIVIFIIAIRFTVCQAYLLNTICKWLHLPFSFRVHKITGIYDDCADDQIHVYETSPYNPYRINVDVNIDQISWALLIKRYPEINLIFS